MKDKYEKGSPDSESDNKPYAFVADPEVASVEEPAAEVIEPEPPVVVPTPQDPLSEAQKEAALVQRMIAEARASIAKKANPGSSYEKKTADAEKRAQALQNKIASLYTTTMWAGKPNYECKVCPYATLDVDLIKQHVTKHI